ncbi:ATP-binding protein [Lacticaseibacillus zhaodongensis]|uniref:ATP-binding protein n=1 Tax=Lacticaseibacillus zhaodongensis TaxID=2668065 RepID=UPI0012D2BEB1|nr:ATP-grasp domain-containing protein [Lacticaseibacillus zhaodongensis]
MQTISKVLVIGSGPVGSAQPATSPAETDLTCRALALAGKDVVLVTSDPDVFRNKKIKVHFYVAPLTAEFISQVIRRERPDSILASAGGQIALNIIIKLDRSGLLRQLGVQVLGSGIDAIKRTEDGQALRSFLKAERIPTPESVYVEETAGALREADQMGYPVLVRRGQSRGIARSSSELSSVLERSIGGGRILIERAIHRFKAIELVLMRDGADNCVLLGTIEDMDPVGVNPANTMVVTPAQTLRDRERNALRAAGRQVLTDLDIRGCATVSFAIDPDGGDWYMLKVKIGLAWGTSLIARATAYPVAGVNTAIALGEELPNIKIGADHKMAASIEPGIDAIVARFPQFAQELLTGAKLGPQLVAGGSIITAGRTLEAVLMQGIYSLSHDDKNALDPEIQQWGEDEITAHVIKANALRLPAIFLALEHGFTVRELAELTQVNPIFIAALDEIKQVSQELRAGKSDEALLRQAKNYGLSDQWLAQLSGKTAAEVRSTRKEAGVVPTYKTIDAMGFIEPDTPTFYGTYEKENESTPGNTPSVIVIEPNAAAPWLNSAHESISSAMLASIKDAGYTPILVGSTPRPLVYPGVKQYLLDASIEHLLDIADLEQPMGVICQTAGREGSRIAKTLSQFGIRILGSTIAERADPMPQSFNDELANLNDGDWVYRYERGADTKDASSHLAIDAISDGETVAVLGVINSLEQNESRAGTVLAVTPPRRGAADLTQRAVDCAVTLASALQLKGFVHMDLAAKGHELTVSFIGPSASATVPFLAKTLRRDCIDLACKVLLGTKLADLGVQSGQLAQSAGVHVLLPVLRSGLTAANSHVATIVQTGLVMGSDHNLGKALIKAFAAAHEPLPDHGTVLLEEGTPAGAALAPRLAALGFQIVGMDHAEKLQNVQLIVMNNPDMALRQVATAHMVPLLNTVSADAIMRIFEARAFALAPLADLES